MKSNPIAVIGAMAQEVVLLRDAMSEREEIHIAGTVIYRGVLEAQQVVLMQCGIGKVNAALGTTLLLNHLNAKAVINTGSAGALADHLKIGDVVIAEALSHHDVNVTAFGYAPGQMAQMPTCYLCDERLRTTAKSVASHFSEGAIAQGLIVSGDQFIHNQDDRLHIKQLFDDALAVEMEAAAIAQVCYRFDVPFVVIRAISDNANGEADVSFEQFLSTAAGHSAQMVRHLLARQSQDPYIY